MSYPFSSIEPKWQQYWEEHRTFRAGEDPNRKKIYILDMYPYPSGAGLHVGHPEGYTATDILSRFKRMNGFNVLHPIGWDAFGLPAERYAMQTNIHPRITTNQNIGTFRRQIRMLGLSYDWSREIDTTDPKYYRWTQWIFLRIYGSWFDYRVKKALPIAELEAELEEVGCTKIDCSRYCADESCCFTAQGWKEMDPLARQSFLSNFRLAYIADIPVNWCEGLGTVLANEEVAEWTEKGYTVVRRPMRQWMMRITAYADRLLEDFAGLDWPSSTIEQQRNWIGKSEGAFVDFGQVKVFTTRPDTIFGATFLVLAPEHSSVEPMTTADRREKVQEYVAAAKSKSDLERGSGAGKSGVFTGSLVTNPATGREIPVWVADYVLMGYGTGAIMAVPGQDERDWEFAEKYELPIVRTVQPPPDFDGKAYLGEGPAVNSDFLNGLNVADAKRRIATWLEEKGIGKASVQFKLRDWLFSRQRYWGEPIPIIQYDDGLLAPLQESELPLLLPELKKFQPSGTTESPLSLAADWVNVVDPATGRKGRRETNTMPQWAGSCWYYLRYLDPSNQASLCTPEKEKYWMPVDLYVGGAEHTVLHLMYSRFWHKVLYDLGFVSTKEPFAKLRHQGTILGEDSRKMSKSRGNVVNPDDVVREYGADAVRLFEMFMGPLEETKPWSTRGVEGVHRFLNRAWRMILNEEGNLLPSVREGALTPGQERLLHETIRKITLDIEGLNFNTAISQLMIFVNEFLNLEVKPVGAMEVFTLLLAPFAPHIAEELWSKLGHTATIAYEPWPSFDEGKMKRDTVELVVQVNGKVRAKLNVEPGLSEERLQALALDEPGVRRHLDGKKIVRIVVVKNKLVSLVVQ